MKIIPVLKKQGEQFTHKEFLDHINSARINGPSPSGAEHQANSKGDDAPFISISRSVLDQFRKESDFSGVTPMLERAVETAIVLTTERIFSDFAKVLKEDSEGFTGYCIDDSDFEDLRKRWGFQK